MNDIERRIQKLIDQYLCGNLSNEEAGELLNAVKAHSDLKKLLQDNREIDFLLRERFALFVPDDPSDLINFDISNRQKILKAVNNLDFSSGPDSYTSDQANIEADSQKLISFTPTDSDEISSKEIGTCEKEMSCQRQKSFVNAVTRGEKTGRERRAFSLRSALTAVLLLAATGIIFFFYDKNSAVGIPVGEPEFFAQVEDLVDPHFEEGQSYKKKQWIGREKIRLKSGLMRLYFANGAEIILEGPNEFSLNGSLDLFCHYGKIGAHIPQDAKGFRISTPLGDFIDQGTEFSLNINNEKADLSVIKGAVDVKLLEKPAVRLKEGNSSRINKKKEIVHVPLKMEQFINSVSFETRLQKDNLQKIELKNQRRKMLTEDPDLLIYFDFTDKNLKQIKNRSVNSSKICKSGRIIGCRRAEGMQDDLPALAMASSNDRVRTKLKQNCPNLTLVAKVRIDLLNETLNNILFNNSTPGLKPSTNVFSWHITSRGLQQIWFGAKSQRFSSNAVPLSKLIGTWCFLSVVFNYEKKTVSFYFDGVPCGMRQWKDKEPFELGLLLLGGIPWSEKTRSLNGTIEEFLVFNKALTKKEIATLCHCN